MRRYEIRVDEAENEREQSGKVKREKSLILDAFWLL